MSRRNRRFSASRDRARTSGILAAGGGGGGGGGTVSSPAAGTQYDDAITLAVPGTGFTGATVISIDGTPYGTTFVNATQVDVAVPTARTVGSPLRTSGSHTVTANTGGSASWTVNAWSEIDETACTGLWIASTANCAGATGFFESFSPWTDLNGTENLAQAGADKPRYVPVGSSSAAWAVPSVDVGFGLSCGRSAQTLNGAEYFFVAAVNLYLGTLAGDHNIFVWSGNFRKLAKPNGLNVLRWTDIPNGGGGAATVTTGTLGANDTMANWGVYSIWRQSDDSVHMQRNADAEYTSSSSNDSSGTGGSMQFGPGQPNPGDAFVPYISTWSADPGATIRARARNKAMILTGLA